MAAAKQLQLATVEEYVSGELRSNVKREYVDGYIYTRTQTTNLHNSVAGALFATLYNALRGHRCQPFNSDTKARVRMSTHTRFYYPDAMVVCDPNPANDSFQDKPVVLAEVISATTRRIDEGEKRDAYLTIPELSAYLLIETSSPRVAVYHRAESGFVPRQYEGMDAVIPLDAIGVRLALVDLYERVDFAAARQDELADTAE